MEEESPEEPSISIKEYLEKNVNIITILGIFNALTIFADSLKNNLLSFCFLGLSIIVTVIFIADFNFNRHKIQPLVLFLIFSVFLTIAEIALIAFFLKKYSFYILGTLLLFGVVFLTGAIPFIILFITYKPVRKANSKSNFIWTLVITVVVITLLIVFNFPIYMLKFIN